MKPEWVCPILTAVMPRWRGRPARRSIISKTGPPASTRPAGMQPSCRRRSIRGRTLPRSVPSNFRVLRLWLRQTFSAVNPIPSSAKISKRRLFSSNPSPRRSESRTFPICSAVVFRARLPRAAKKRVVGSLRRVRLHRVLKNSMEHRVRVERRPSTALRAGFQRRVKALYLLSSRGGFSRRGIC